jgi:hypothetical protein
VVDSQFDSDWHTGAVLSPERKANFNQARSIDIIFEVFTTVTMKNAVLWDVKPCGSCKNRRFRESYRLHHQGEKS